MTDGTSQGLFIVVAIVIFGIFVVLAYILFEDTLSPALASMFIDATEQATDRLTNNYYAISGLTPSLESDFDFEPLTGRITNYKGTDTRVVIPYVISGVEVKLIGKSAFSNKGLSEVYIPNTVTALEGDEESYVDGAFRDNNLTSIIIPDSVTHIGRDSFFNNKIKTVQLSKNLTFLGIGAFHINKITSLEIPESLTDIKFAAFKKNELKVVKLPSNLKNIRRSVFEGNTTLEKIIIPDSVNYIDSFAFLDTGIKEVTVPQHTTYLADTFPTGAVVHIK